MVPTDLQAPHGRLLHPCWSIDLCLANQRLAIIAAVTSTTHIPNMNKEWIQIVILWVWDPKDLIDWPCQIHNKHVNRPGVDDTWCIDNTWSTCARGKFVTLFLSRALPSFFQGIIISPSHLLMVWDQILFCTWNSTDEEDTWICYAMG